MVLFLGRLFGAGTLMVAGTTAVAEVVSATHALHLLVVLELLFGEDGLQLGVIGLTLGAELLHLGTLLIGQLGTLRTLLGGTSPL